MIERPSMGPLHSVAEYSFHGTGEKEVARGSSGGSDGGKM